MLALLMIILGIATIFSTKYQLWQLRSHDESKKRSVIVSDFALSREHNPSDGGQSGDDDDDYHVGRVDDEIMESYPRDEGEMASMDEFDDRVDNDFDDDVGDFEDIAKAILDSDDDHVLVDLTSPIGHSIQRPANNIFNGTSAASPACHPHFNLALNNNRWNSKTKFKRIYFYHARKAGGSSMHKYLSKVANHYGLELMAVEWSGMEEPGTYDDGATFYVTHLREPVDRSISQFKYQGRWSCADLVHGSRNFTPTEDNANRIETWNQTGGHTPFDHCKRKKGPKKEGKRQPFFFLGSCAVNCYVQWFSGVCPEMGMKLDQQYQMARAKVLKYNFVAVIEKLKDPRYVEAVENYFGVAGLTKRGTPYCQKKSHKANEKFPLTVSSDTRQKLTKLNEVDSALYHDLSDCLDSGMYNFPKWDPNRFALHSYNITMAKAEKKKAKTAKKEREKKRKAEEK